MEEVRWHEMGIITKGIDMISVKRSKTKKSSNNKTENNSEERGLELPPVLLTGATTPVTKARAIIQQFATLAKNASRAIVNKLRLPIQLVIQQDAGIIGIQY